MVMIAPLDVIRARGRWNAAGKLTLVAPRCEYNCSQLASQIFFHMLSIVFTASTHVVMVAIKNPVKNDA
jgi:hypothetical protein